MAQTKTYAPDQVVFNFGPNLITGFAAGSFITVEREVESFAKRVGAQGDTTRVRSANKSGRVTIRLKQVADSNQILSSILNLDEILGNGKYPLFVADVGGSSLFSAAEAWIVKNPSPEFADDESMREWMFDCSHLILNHGGNS